MASLESHDVIVLIPAYNEAARIAQVVRAVKERGYGALVVDDGSSDPTAAKALAAGALVERRATNGGKGAAIRRGLETFLHLNAKAVILMDSDGQHDPDELPLFLGALAGADVVVGNRLDRPDGMSALRCLTNRLMSWTLSRLAGRRIPDTQCGYRALTREAVSRLRLKTDRFEIESEMLLEAAARGLRIVSVPVRSIYAGERSRIRPFGDTLRFFLFLIKYRHN